MANYHQIASSEKSSSEDLLHPEERRTLAKRYPKQIAVVSHAVLFLTGLLLGGLVFGLATRKTAPVSSRTPIPTEVFSPRVPTVMLPDYQFLGWSDNVNRHWLKILYGTGEGVWIPDATKYGLGAGFPAPNHNKSDTRTEFYHISNHHQLHCLNMIRMSHYRPLDKVQFKSDSDREQAAYHVEHCIEYLRVSIMCGDSLVVEAGSPAGTPGRHVADKWGKPLGWGITKQCIDWEKLSKWQTEQSEAYELS